MHKMMSKSRMSWHTERGPRGSVCSRRQRRGHGLRRMTAREAVPCHVYLIVHRDEPRFKIGISQDPMTRARHLPDFLNIALESSMQALFPNRVRAFEVERSLHRLLSGLRLHVVAEDGDPWSGGTEWFAIQGLSLAVNILQNTPLTEDGEGAVVLTRLSEPDDKNAKATVVCARERRLRRLFDATQANLAHMNEVVKVFRRLNDELTITWRSAGQGAPQKGAVMSETQRTALDLVHAEMVCIHGLGSHWNGETLGLRYRLSDSAFWMFDTGLAQPNLRKRSWVTRIQFDWQDKSTLLLCVADRKVLQELPGGGVMLRMWDSLWAD